MALKNLTSVQMVRNFKVVSKEVNVERKVNFTRAHCRFKEIHQMDIFSETSRQDVQINQPEMKKTNIPPE